MAKTVDVVIIGAGIAGLTAGIYLKRSSLSGVVLEKAAPGGRLLNIHAIDNYPSESLIPGPKLAEKIVAHAAELGVVPEYGNVQGVQKQGDHFLVATDMDTYEAKAVIVATGTTTKTLGVPGEKESRGEGSRIVRPAMAISLKEKTSPSSVTKTGRSKRRSIWPRSPTIFMFSPPSLLKPPRPMNGRYVA
jgi:thioredoxin reductase